MARDFDGTADYLSRTDASGITGYPCSMACRVKFDSFSSAPFFLHVGNSTSANARAGLYAQASGALTAAIKDAAGTATRQWDTSGTMSTGVWYSCVGVFTSSSSVQAYINKVSTGSYVGTGSPSWPTFNRTAIGALIRNAVSNYTNGQIAEVALWDGWSLTQDEIDALADGVSPLRVKPGRLVNYWPLFGRGGAGGNEEDWIAGATLTQTSSPALYDHPRVVYPGRRQVAVAPAASSSHPALSSLTAVISGNQFQPRWTAS